MSPVPLSTDMGMGTQFQIESPISKEGRKMSIVQIYLLSAYGSQEYILCFCISVDRFLARSSLYHKMYYCIQPIETNHIVSDNLIIAQLANIPYFSP
jgi:hypothetical protein